MSKREEIRQKRIRARRQRQIRLLLGVGAFGVAIAAILIYQNLTLINNIIIPEPANYPLTEGTAMGDPEAPILVEEFSDFQCSACKTFLDETAHQIIDEYVATGQVYYVVRHFPQLGQESLAAANASMCAAEQDKFWEYHDLLYANQRGHDTGAFSSRRLEAFAEILSLDLEEFNACVENGEYEDVIVADFAESQVRGVSGTPSVFVNGTEIAPGFVPSYTTMKAALEQALEESGTAP